MFYRYNYQKSIKRFKTIVLPEATDIRTLKATEKILQEKIANIILIGNEKEIKKLADENNIDIKSAQIINPSSYDKDELKIMAKKLHELRKAKRNVT